MLSMMICVDSITELSMQSNLQADSILLNSLRQGEDANAHGVQSGNTLLLYATFGCLTR